MDMVRKFDIKSMVLGGLLGAILMFSVAASTTEKAAWDYKIISGHLVSYAQQPALGPQLDQEAVDGSPTHSRITYHSSCELLRPKDGHAPHRNAAALTGTSRRANESLPLARAPALLDPVNVTPYQRANAGPKKPGTGARPHTSPLPRARTGFATPAFK